MFLEYGSFSEKMARERAKRVPQVYELGKIYACGADNRVVGRTMTRNEHLGREVRMDLTATRPHIKREADPEAAAANEKDESKADSRWVISAQPGKEFFCKLCGANHPNPALRHTYRSCVRCSGVLTQPGELHAEVAALRQAEEAARTAAAGGSKMAGNEGWKPAPLQILAASLGHPKDSSKAVDVAAQLRRLVVKRGEHGEVALRRGQSLFALLGVLRDPARGSEKVLMVRYELIDSNSADWEKTGTRGELRTAVNANGTLPLTFRLANPTRPPLVRVGKATYGHPLGAKRGRGAFDVTEALQGRVDATDGAFLEVKHFEDLHSMFDDPSPGMKKELVLDYELMGVGDTVQEDERGDYMVAPISAKLAPKFAPLVLVRSATFGMSRAGADARRKELTKQLYDLGVIANKKAQRLYVSPADVERMRAEPALREEMAALHPDALEIGSVDVSATVQRLIDGPGGGKRLCLPKGTDLRTALGLTDVMFDLPPETGKSMSAAERLAMEANTLSRCRFKQLRVEYVITGHDSEQRTSSDERTSSGFERNFIRYRPGACTIRSVDEEDPEEEEEEEEDNEGDEEEGGTLLASPVGAGGRGTDFNTVAGGSTVVSALTRGTVAASAAAAQRAESKPSLSTSGGRRTALRAAAALAARARSRTAEGRAKGRAEAEQKGKAGGGRGGGGLQHGLNSLIEGVNVHGGYEDKELPGPTPARTLDSVDIAATTVHIF